jgi:hypothetical protein
MGLTKAMRMYLILLESCTSQLSSLIIHTRPHRMVQVWCHRMPDGLFYAPEIVGPAECRPMYEISKNLTVGRRRLEYEWCKILTVGWEYESHKPWLSIMCLPGLRNSRVYLFFVHFMDLHVSDFLHPSVLSCTLLCHFPTLPVLQVYCYVSPLDWSGLLIHWLWLQPELYH